MSWRQVSVITSVSAPQLLMQLMPLTHSHVAIHAMQVATEAFDFEAMAKDSKDHTKDKNVKIKNGVEFQHNCPNISP